MAVCSEFGRHHVMKEMVAHHAGVRIAVVSRSSPDITATLCSIRCQSARSSLGLELPEPTSQAASSFGEIDRVLLMGTAIGMRGVGP
jgi:ribulose-phosphate 3-epimerase